MIRRAPVPDIEPSTLLHIATPPHIRHTESVDTIMRSVVISLIPAIIASTIFFGYKSLLLVITCVASSVAFEWLIARYLFKQKNTPLKDFSATVTGILLALSLPSHTPLWMAFLAALFAIGVVKWCFGGIGNNFINPAIGGRTFILICYPAIMVKTTPTLFGSFNGISQQIDGITTATPLTAFKTALHSGTFQALDFQEALTQLFIGNISGNCGETSIIALLIGAAFLLYKRIIGLSIPISFIGTVFLLFWIFNGMTTDLLSADALTIALYQILAGGLFLSAFYMASDPVTCPNTSLGRVIFGFGCGAITVIIRKFGSYPEGVYFSILIMNCFVPLINRYTIPRLYGKVSHS